MNAERYNNVISHTLSHCVGTDSGSLLTARAVFKNMGVALPQGTLKEVLEVLKSNQYMSWAACSPQKAQESANQGIAAIGINEHRILILAAQTEEPVTDGSDISSAKVATLSGDIPADSVADLQFFWYSRPEPKGVIIYCNNSYLSKNQMSFNAEYIMEFLRLRNWTKQAVCGLLGNMEVESTINPGLWHGLKENDTACGFGLLQWTPATRYTDWAKKEHMQVDNIVSQLKLILHDLYCDCEWQNSSKFPLTFAEYTRSKLSPYYLARIFMSNYIKHNTDYENIRKRSYQAMFWYNLLK